MEVKYFTYANGQLKEEGFVPSQTVAPTKKRRRQKVYHSQKISVILGIVVLGAMLTYAMLSEIASGASEYAPLQGVSPKAQSVSEFLTAVTYASLQPIKNDESEEQFPLENQKEAQELGVFYEVPAAEDGSKRYMDFRTITATNSTQWELQQSAWTDGYGFRRCGDMYMVAMGTYYTSQCGKTFHIVLDNGYEFDVLVSDVKMDAHTDAKHQHRNGNVLEFIVDAEVIPSLAAKMGDMSYAFDAMNSTISTIQEIF